jgi:alanine dehydrogenase
LIIGCPKERKPQESRVGLTPGGAPELSGRGHRVLVERGAGERCGIPDAAYLAAGAEILDTAAEVWALAGLIIKVKEPLPAEFKHLRNNLVLYAYLHLAAAPELARALLDSGTIGVAYETIQLEDGSLPLLAPMSEVAGRMAVQIGAYYLETPSGGKGILLSGVPGVARGHVVILGGGTVGANAARVALGMGARVTILDVNLRRLVALEEIFGSALTTLYSNPLNIAQAVATADLLIGAVLVPGAKAPTLVTEEMVKTMEPGSVVLDVAVDQGGCIETCRPTTHAEPTYVLHGVLHYCVTNMPGAVARTSTYALANATTPYALRLAELGVERAVERDASLARGINTYRGKVTCAPVAAAISAPYTPLDKALGQGRG